MTTTEIKFQEIDASEALDIYGGAPTKDTSLAYDIAWTCGFIIYCLRNIIN